MTLRDQNGSVGSATGSFEPATGSDPSATGSNKSASLPAWPKSQDEIIEAGRALLALKAKHAGRFAEWFAAQSPPYSYRSSRVWMQAARDADAEIAGMVGWIGEAAPDGLPEVGTFGFSGVIWNITDEPDRAPEFGELIRKIIKAEPLARNGDVVTALDDDIARLQRGIENRVAVRNRLAAMPSRAMLVTSPIGREVAATLTSTNDRTAIAQLLAQGETQRAVLRCVVMQEWLDQAIQIIERAGLGLEDDVGAPVTDDWLVQEMRNTLTSSEITFPEPGWPADEAELEREIRDLRALAVEALATADIFKSRSE